MTRYFKLLAVVAMAFMVFGSFVPQASAQDGRVVFVPKPHDPLEHPASDAEILAAITSQGSSDDGAGDATPEGADEVLGATVEAAQEELAFTGPGDAALLAVIGGSLIAAGTMIVRTTRRQD